MPSSNDAPDRNDWSSSAPAERAGSRPRVESALPWVLAFVGLVVVSGVLYLGFEAVRYVRSDSSVSHPAPDAEETQAEDAHPLTEESKRILARMAEVYSRCRTYSDKGVQQTTYRGSIEYSRTITFQTSFERNEGFRFEYAEKAPGPVLWSASDGDRRTVIWNDHHEAKKWSSSSDRVSTRESLLSALGEVSGVSGGTSRTIPLLLLEAQAESQSIMLDSQTSASTTNLDGRACYMLSGTRNGHPRTLWIDTDQYLLRRIDLTYENDGDMAVEKVTTFEPAVDIDIDPRLLVFEPPK